MSKTNKEKSGLKMLAADAKDRLKNGYHCKDPDGKPAQENYFDVVKKSFAYKDISVKDRVFYNKVEKILSEGEITNPILRLVDEAYLNTLDYSSKQRYLLEVSEKFNKIKKEIEDKKKSGTKV